MTYQNTPAARRMKRGAAALLAIGLLAGSIAPAAAAGTWPSDEGFSGRPHQSSFHRHFWRGSQISQTRPSGAEMMAFADENDQMDEAMSYCADRFKSYDPSTGTYLGYDGNEHACP